MILSGDIGGTKTTLALFAAKRGAPGFDRDAAVVETFDSRAFADFPEILRAFCGRHRPRLRAGCIGIAGPVRGNRCTATNLPWTIDGDELARALVLGELTLLNDLEAVGYGIDVLRSSEIEELQAGSPDAAGNRAVIAAGTGLGEAGLCWDGTAHRPFASEGGHSDFAPQGELEIELLRFLRQEHGHVSWERVLSGPGVVNIYRFLRLLVAAGSAGDDREPEGLADPMLSEDPAEVIWSRAASGESALCARTFDTFTRLYGAEAGILALKTMATGGVYVGGGIAPKILAWLKRGAFLDAFCAKGRMRPLLEAMPVRVLLNPQTALLGAARRAAQNLG